MQPEESSQARKAGPVQAQPARVPLIDDIVEINRRLCFDIWNIASASDRPTGLSPRLIFPTTRAQQPRLSEQEARFLYCSLLNNVNYFYSAETPTVGQYKQKGQEPSTAASDLSLYCDNGTCFQKVVNVEFKAHNPPQELIRKDIEKILGEGVAGNWFHILKNIDGSSLGSICTKISKSLIECESTRKHDLVHIVFTFCVVEKKWGCIKHFSTDASADFYHAAASFAGPEYKIQRDTVVVSNHRGWTIVSPNAP